jgi:hypothetical protein
MTAQPCTGCGKPTEATYRLCPECLDARAIAERETQGLAAEIDDPVVIDKVATIVRAGRRSVEKPEPKP